MRAAPILVVRVELEAIPVAIVHAGSLEDEQRLRAWLASPATRMRILDAIADALDDLEETRIS